MKGFAAVACLCVCSIQALAIEQEPVVYVGAAYTHVKYSESAFDADLAGAGGLIGFPVNENFSVEFRYMQGVEDERVLGGLDVELKKMLGGYLRAGLPITRRFYPYVVAGRSKGELEGSGSSERKFEKSGLSYGAGLNISWPESAAILNVEYMQLLDKDDFEIEGLTVGLQVQY